MFLSLHQFLNPTVNIWKSQKVCNTSFESSLSSRTFVVVSKYETSLRQTSTSSGGVSSSNKRKFEIFPSQSWAKGGTVCR